MPEPLFPISYEHGGEYAGEVYLTDDKGKRIEDYDTVSRLMDQMTRLMNGVDSIFRSQLCGCSIIDPDVLEMHRVGHRWDCKGCGKKWIVGCGDDGKTWETITPPPAATVFPAQDIDAEYGKRLASLQPAATPPPPIQAASDQAPPPAHPATHTPDPAP